MLERRQSWKHNKEILEITGLEKGTFRKITAMRSGRFFNELNDDQADTATLPPLIGVI